MPAVFPLFAGVAAAGPPVTSKEAPSPGPEAARRWVAAGFQAPLLEYCDQRYPRSEAARMLAAMRRGPGALGPGAGWFEPGRRRHDWAWVAARYDADRDGRVSRKEFAGPAEYFASLDRDGDGAITAEDFDWSESSPWVRLDAQSQRLFRAIDADGDGRLDEAEVRAYFKKAAGAKGHLTPDDLRAALGGSRARGGAPAGKAPARGASPAVWFEALLAGDLGSPFEGPRVGQTAPDFTLASPDGKKTVTLSDFRDKRPVVLIFGSFT
jgi:Ca2+-binding EF-hand superfamily protein